MDSQFSRCLAITLAYEGGWADRNLKDDPGGATMRGITQKTFAAYKGRPVTKDELRNISMVEVEAIYRKNYWNYVKADDLPAGLNLTMFDFAVHSYAQAPKELQRALGITVDGGIGFLTLDAVKRRNVTALINDVCDRRLAFLRSLKNYGANRVGWERRVAAIRAKSLAMAGGRKVTPPEPPAATAARANPADIKPTAKPNAKEKIAAGAGTAGGVIADAVEKLTPYQELAGTIKWVCLALVVAGVGIMLWRLFQKGD